MLDLSILEKFDTQQMYKVYDRWPEIARESFESNQDSVNFVGINHIVFAGMGGSGSIGDIFSAILSNSKIHVITEDVIESCHNGIVSWETSSKIQPILIRGQEDNEKTKERWDIIHQYFSENKIDCKEIISVEGNILTKIICLIYLLDYTSIFLAVEKEIDPSPVKSIDFIKSKLN